MVILPCIYLNVKFNSNPKKDADHNFLLLQYTTKMFICNSKDWLLLRPLLCVLCRKSYTSKRHRGESWLHLVYDVLFIVIDNALKLFYSFHVNTPLVLINWSILAYTFGWEISSYSQFVSWRGKEPFRKMRALPPCYSQS